MSNNPMVCSGCQRANFQAAENCQHCGEPLFQPSSVSDNSFGKIFMEHAINGLSWLWEECCRWWEIGNLHMQLKELKKARTEFMKKTGTPSQNGGLDFSSESREKLVAMSDEISRLTSHEEELRTSSWALTPKLLLAGVTVVFSLGLMFLHHGEILKPVVMIQRAIVSAQPEKTTRVSLEGFSVVKRAVWFEGSLFIGGDGGLVVYDPQENSLEPVPGIDENFYVRDLNVSGNSLLIAGLDGIFSYETVRGITRLYEDADYSMRLANRIFLSADGAHLIGTIGNGLFRGNGFFASQLPGTEGLTIRDLQWINGKLWIIHEHGVLEGDGKGFSPVTMQVFSGKDVFNVVSDESLICFGTNQGLIFADRRDGTMVWTILSPPQPKIVRDLLSTDAGIVVVSDEGLFLYSKGEFVRVSPEPGSTIAVSGNLLATVSPQSIMIYEFAVTAQSAASVGTRVVPRVAGEQKQTTAATKVPSVKPQPVPESVLPDCPENSYN